MRVSEFQRLVDDEFGRAHGRVIVEGHTLGALDYRTAREAIDAGVPLREVWIALVREMDVPKERWLGVDRPIREGWRAD